MSVLKFSIIFFAIIILASTKMTGQEPRLMLPLGHTFEIFSANFSPDGKYVVTTSEDSTIKVWKTLSGELLLDLRPTLKYEDEEIVTAIYSPNGRKILCIASESISLYDALSGRLIKYLKLAIRDDDNVFFVSDEKVHFDKKILNLKTYKITPDLNNYLASRPPPNREVTDSLILDKIEKGYQQNRMQEDLEDELGIDQGFIANYSLDHTMIVTTASSSAAIWDALSGRLISRLKAHSSQVWSAIYSRDGKKIVTASADGFARIWDAKEAKLITSIRCYSGHFYMWTAAFSPDASMIICAPFTEVAEEDGDDRVTIWDIEKKQRLFRVRGHYNRIVNSCFSPDGKYVIFPDNDDTVRIRTVRPFRRYYRFVHGIASAACFSEDGSKFMIVGDPTISIYETKRMVLITQFDPSTGEGIMTASFSPDGKRVIVFMVEGESSIWDAQTGKEIITGKAYQEEMGKTLFLWLAVYSPDMKTILTQVNSNDLTLWDEGTGKKRFDLKGNKAFATSASYSPLSDKIVTSSYDLTCRIWDARTGRLLYTFLGVDSTNYLIQTPSGYYMGSQNAAKKLHYVTQDLNVISFEQLDVKFNRPDKVLEAMGDADPLLVRSYYRAYLKRLKKMRIDTTAFKKDFRMPETEVVNRNKIQFDQKENKLSLVIKAKDNIYKIDRFNIWVNEVPVYGQRGINLRRKNSNRFDTTVTITLSAGENIIETSITNFNGSESYRVPLTVIYTPAEKQKEMTRFVGIGIDQFTDSKYNLQYSSKDIRDLSLKLKEKFGDNVIIDTLFNEQVTVNNVKALKQKLLQTSVNDKVIIAYSGHGMLSKDFDYYLSTYSVNFEKPEQNGLPYDELESLLDSIPARKKLMLIDACHSGEVDKEDLITLNASSDSLIKGLKPVAYKQEGHLGLKNSFELMQSLFVNVGKSTGATIISAAAGTQFALERNDLKNGVFTYCILEAMKSNASMKISELKSIVGKRVEELTKGLQKPTSRNETIAVDWTIW
ncbi:MAG: caspase family protein [Chitinophagaceae bacterium]